MSLSPPGITSTRGDLNEQTRKQIDDLFSILDEKVRKFSDARGLSPNQVRLLQPLHCCMLVGDIEIFVVIAVHDLGGISRRNYLDFSGKEMNIETEIFLAERDLGFQNAFGFKFNRSVLDLDDDKKETAITEIATRCIDDEVMNIEKQSRIVRLNPIFEGREFLINEQLVFVLSPFIEPFNTIYSDHIKPSIENIDGLSCLRADDIYDNRSIIEDIWRCTNEARIIISELTGRNANVFYETGIAHTIGKEVILITQSMDDVPFDLKHLRCIVYEYIPRGIKNLEDNLKSTALNILARRS